MEMPFNFVVIYIMKLLKDRGMPLSINKSELINFFNEILKKGYFTAIEKKELIDDFDFENELDNLLYNDYYKYFGYDKSNIVFDVEYVFELNELLDCEIEREEEKGNKWFVLDIISMIDYDTDFLEIIGIKINKRLYNYFLDMDNNVEILYNSLARMEKEGISLDKNFFRRIKKTLFKRLIFIMNAKSLLSDIEYKDFVNYSFNMTNKNTNYDDISLLLHDDSFDESDIMDDLYMKSIFTGDDLYFSSLSQRLSRDTLDESKDIKYSTIKFYLTFLELLEKEINKNTLMREELIEIKYRLMFALDSSFDTMTIVNNYNVLDGIEFKEDYIWAMTASDYFIKEVLMYDDKKYKNEEYNTENVMLYIDNLIKKLFIETYYKLTLDKGVIDMIKSNKMYGVNEISSNLLKDIVDKPKTKIKEV